MPEVGGLGIPAPARRQFDALRTEPQCGLVDFSGLGLTIQMGQGGGQDQMRLDHILAVFDRFRGGPGRCLVLSGIQLRACEHGYEYDLAWVARAELQRALEERYRLHRSSKEIQGRTTDDVRLATARVKLNRLLCFR